MTKEEEKCWIGCQEKPAGAITICRCHSYGGIGDIGWYLERKYRNHIFASSKDVVERLKALIALVDVSPRLGKIRKTVDGLEPINANPASDCFQRLFEGFDAFSRAFWKDSTVNLAYLYSVHNNRPERHVWLVLSKLPLFLFLLAGRG